MPNATESLIAINVAWLRQALELLDTISDDVFRTPPPNMAPHRVSSHLRHILEFYECFLYGAGVGVVDYDARRRDEAVERCRQHAAARARLVLRGLESLPWPGSHPVCVRMEDAAAGEGSPLLHSSVARELQALSSHTIHHFALIAVTLRGHGIDMHPDFGTSPSTLRYRASQGLGEPTAEAA